MLILIFIILGPFIFVNEVFSQPISIDPINPHYFYYQGKTMAIVSSSEHYGAVINKSFDYIKYLQTLAADSLNYTRLFTGTYFEYPNDHGIQFNTLAPPKEELLLPWQLDTTSNKTGNKWRVDLDSWNKEYFDRLIHFIAKAEQCNIIVELTFFSSNYGNWRRSPFYFKNNINNTDSIGESLSMTLDNGNILEFQEKLVRKIVREVNPFSNIIFEIQNEPWVDNGYRADTINEYLAITDEKCTALSWQNYVDIPGEKSLAWQERIAQIITDEEFKFKNRHLISLNYCNFRYSLNHLISNISIYQFHYAYPEVVNLNYHFNKLIGFNESGFAGNKDNTYRKQAWNFILAGGGLYNMLDYSFYVGFEDGSCVNNAPGGGSTAFRKQMKYLCKFINSFELEKLSPDYQSVIGCHGFTTRTLSEVGKQYGIYIQGKGLCNIKLKIPQGKYMTRWFNPISGEYSAAEYFTSENGYITLKSPNITGDYALKLIKE